MSFYAREPDFTTYPDDEFYYPSPEALERAGERLRAERPEMERRALAEADRLLLPARLFVEGKHVDRARAEFDALMAKRTELSALTYERAFGECEARYLKAQARYASLLQELTGTDVERIIRRLAA